MELGVDHSEGRTYAGWNFHMVLSAVAHTFIQREPAMNSRHPLLTFPAVRSVTAQIFTGLLSVTHPKWVARARNTERLSELRI